MTHYDHNHYFIELLSDLAPELSSGELVRMRQERARDFAAELRTWFEAQGVAEDVSDLKVTALGRIMLTAAPDVAERLADLDHPDVATISLSSSVPGLATSRSA
jgi:hypothetical protein